MTETTKTPTRKMPVSQQKPAPNSNALVKYFLAFEIGDRQLALPLEKVERVIRMAALVPVPEAPEWISGLLNLHGMVIPVINLRKRLGLSQEPVHPDHRIVVMQAQNRKLGVIAETVADVVRVSGEHLGTPEGTLKDSPLLNAVFQNDDAVYLVLEADEIDTGALLEFTESE